ncbi:bile acid:sodium symporter family protein [Streptomyces sp. NPDC050516]|uniref:bile acid:sodium symporter family protein n=1 Tax=Streptomyces sp. NPDC050516 TaxID=3365621 RepID=UPI0037BCD1D3
MLRILRSVARHARHRVDWYIVALFAVIGVATLAPVEGAAADGVSLAVRVAVGLLFFLYGARLSPQAAYDGLRHWRLHVPILALTFVAFPLAGLAVGLLPGAVLSTELAVGVLFLTILPSTVQSSIAFTSMARGNVAAAICSASFSTVLGVVLTPVLVVALIGQTGGEGMPIRTSQLGDIALQLLVPFLAGQVARRWVTEWLGRHRALITVCDRGSILLVVYSAFSRGMTTGIWQRVSPGRLLLLAALCVLLLVLALQLANGTARLIGLPYADRVTAVFCGSNKSLASGLPMATVLFPAERVGIVILPLMLYHTIQLVACAWLARRWSTNRSAAPGTNEDRGTGMGIRTGGSSSNPREGTSANPG